MKSLLSLLTFLVLGLPIYGQGAYKAWEFEAKEGGEAAIAKIFDDMFESTDISYNSGGFVVTRFDFNGTSPSTHRIVVYGDLSSWGYDGRPDPDYEVALALERAGSHVERWTKSETGLILYTGDKDFEEYPYRVMYQMKVSDADLYVEAYTEMMEALEPLRGDRPAHLGSFNGGIENGETHWAYMGYKSWNDYLTIGAQIRASEAYEIFSEKVDGIRTVSKISTEIRLKEYN